GRMRIAAALRQFFAARDFVEVETTTLVPSPGNETHLHAFATDLVAPTGTRARMYLRTSPEFACKKLLAAGERRIVEFARSFRNRERGILHHPEFTLVEWYRAQEPYEVLMEDCGAILALAAEAAGSKRFSFRDRAIDPFAAPERLTVAEAFARHAGIDLPPRLPPQPPPRLPAVPRARRGAGTSGGRRRPPLAFARPPTAPGATFSAACWSKRSNRPSGKDARRSFTNIRQYSRRSPGRRPPIPGSPSASSSMPAGSSLRTASASSSMWPSNANGSKTRWRKRGASTARGIPSTRIFSGG